MNLTDERQRNQAGYRRMKETIARKYGTGRFVAIADGHVVADADTLDDLRNLLEAQGRDLGRTLVVQAGMEHPESAIILIQEERRP